jgi:small subunit ribosomal protein S21
MIEVTLEDGDPIDRALRTFKKKVQKSGLLQELRKRRHYSKPSVARQLKSAAAKQRRARAARRSS